MTRRQSTYPIGLSCSNNRGQLSVLGSPAGKLIIPIALLIAGGLGYVLRRRIEGAPEAQRIDSLSRAADLREKLVQQNVSIHEVRAFRDLALAKPVQDAADTAQQYIDRAQYMVEHNTPANVQDWPEAMTQAEMNQQAATMFAQADDELTALLVEKLATSDPQEAEYLQRSQDAWNEWRHHEASWDSQVWEGGTIRPLLVSTKLEQLTRERIAALRSDGSLERPALGPPIQHRRTPADLPNHIEPGTTKDRVRDLIGAPHFISGDYWHYRFIETRIEIVFRGEVVHEITFALIEGQTYSTGIAGFDVLDFGTLTFGKLAEYHGPFDVEFDSTLRTNELWTKVRIGPAGAWSEYFFGATIPYHGGTMLLNTDFHWDRENNRLVTPLENIVINWFGRIDGIDDDSRPVASWYIQ